MGKVLQFTAIVEREEDLFVALSPELDIASQGESEQEARLNLIEAIELFVETAAPDELARRLHEVVSVTRVDVRVA